MGVQLSIIVPVYNAEKYLVRCIESLLVQLNDEYELILVDDGSTDGSGAICDQFAKADARVKVFHRENCGVSSSRNFGLDVARGELIMFVDADDYVERNLISVLLQALQGHDADACCCSYNHVKKDKTRVRHVVKDKAIDILTGDDIFNRYVIKLYGKVRGDGPLEGLASVWGWIYTKSLIGLTRFKPELKLGQDRCFDAEVFAKCKKLVLVDQALYNYCDNPESATKKRRDDRWQLTVKRIEAFLSIAKETKIPLEMVLPRIVTYAGNGLLHAVRMQVEYGDSIKEIHSSILNMLNNPIFSDGFRYCAWKDSIKPLAFFIDHKLYWTAAIFAKLFVRLTKY